MGKSVCDACGKAVVTVQFGKHELILDANCPVFMFVQPVKKGHPGRVINKPACPAQHQEGFVAAGVDHRALCKGKRRRGTRRRKGWDEEEGEE